ncbi:FAD-dependent monooxygenase [Streptomyces sp. SL13]|uniref:FAD-dependent monooxygenase n=1 Tax=Streptantibioticus silvisoli TaxID=2705255 RepID=A0AA90KID0_9ACTN|nr:FAD-dependent monooxygenase [Streptantibioticus silvisoli]MDI5972494.1 FAD-dependent monooxygenase [Streptantibioticus silvisoli]
MRGGRVAVVGGSIAGCAVAMAAHRAGAAEVVVFERTPGRLEDRGVGVGVRADLYEELAGAGYLGDDAQYVRLDRRAWFTADGSRTGRAVGAMEFSFRAYNWGSLWRALRDRVPERVDYRRDTPVAAVTAGTDGARVALADGTAERFDLVVGADGYRSVVREAMFPGVRPQWAGYLLWRGIAPARLMPPRETGWRDGDAAMIGFPGGHAMVFLIPDRDGGEQVVNWALYSRPPASAVLDPADPTSLPPGTVTADLLAHLDLLIDELPPYWAELVRLTPAPEIFVQPIYDLQSGSFAAGRLALAGDAAAVVRPHTGGGAVKALQDAIALEAALSGTDDLDAALLAYDVRRAPIGRAMVALGRGLGTAQVLDTPDWAAMDQDALHAWWAAIPGQLPLGGRALIG